MDDVHGYVIAALSGCNHGFARAHMKKVSHDLSILQVRARSDRFIARTRFFDVLRLEAGIDEKIQPEA